MTLPFLTLTGDQSRGRCMRWVTVFYTLFVSSLIIWSCFYTGDAPSLHRCTVSVLHGFWPSATHGCHCCDLPWCPCAIHDSNRCPSLPRWDRPASKHHCDRSRTVSVCYPTLHLSDIANAELVIASLKNESCHVSQWAASIQPPLSRICKERLFRRSPHSQAHWSARRSQRRMSIVASLSASKACTIYILPTELVRSPVYVLQRCYCGATVRKLWDWVPHLGLSNEVFAGCFCFCMTSIKVSQFSSTV